MSVTATAIRAKYYPVAKLAFELFGYKLTSATVSRWARGTNKNGRQLPTIVMGGKYMCTEADLIAFVETKREIPQREPLTSTKAPSPEARAKRIEKAKAELERAGI